MVPAGEGAPEGTAFENVGKTLHTMKTQLRPGSKHKNAGAFYGKDLAWWRSQTRDILHPSVLAYEDKGDPAKEWLGKLCAILDASAEEMGRLPSCATPVRTTPPPSADRRPQPTTSTL